MKKFDFVLNVCTLAAIALLITWGAWNLLLLFIIPPVPPIHERPYVSFNNDINRGVSGDIEYYFGSDEWVTNLDTSFYWGWYGLQNVAIVHWSYGPDGTQECAIHVEWTNGLETCLNRPSVMEEK